VTVPGALTRARAAGLVLRAEGNRLLWKAAQAPPPELLAELGAHRADVIRLLRAAAHVEALVAGVLAQNRHLKIRRAAAIRAVAIYLTLADAGVLTEGGARQRALQQSERLQPWSERHAHEALIELTQAMLRAGSLAIDLDEL
jgi:hypothetical protein